MNIQGWLPFRWTGLISLQSKGLSRDFSSTTVWKHHFFGAQLSLRSNSQHLYMTTGKIKALTIQIFVSKVKMLVAQSCLTLYNPLDCSPWDSPGKNARVSCHSLLQGIFPTQGSNLGVLYCGWILYHLSHQGSPLAKRCLCFLLCVLSRCVLQVEWTSPFCVPLCVSLHTPQVKRVTLYLRLLIISPPLLSRTGIMMCPSSCPSVQHESRNTVELNKHLLSKIKKPSPHSMH